jgi:hypothetical protein
VRRLTPRGLLGLVASVTVLGPAGGAAPSGRGARRRRLFPLADCLSLVLGCCGAALPPAEWHAAARRLGGARLGRLLRFRFAGPGPGAAGCAPCAGFRDARRVLLYACGRGPRPLTAEERARLEPDRRPAGGDAARRRGVRAPAPAPR